MTQVALPFKYEQEKKGLGLTALAGLPFYLDMARVMDLADSIDRHVTVRQDSQGGTDSQVVMSLILMNIAGGDCVDDLKWSTTMAFGIDYEAKAGSAVMPEPSAHPQGFAQANNDLLSFVQRCRWQ